MAYGARLESVLGESPRGFESPILRDVMSRDVVASEPQEVLLLGFVFLGSNASQG